MQISEVSLVASRLLTAATIRARSAAHLGLNSVTVAEYAQSLETKKLHTSDRLGGPFASLTDLRLGTDMEVADKTVRCKTCNEDHQTCIGHGGHINMPFAPIIYPHVYETVSKFMEVHCQTCGSNLIETGSCSRVIDQLLLDQKTWSSSISLSPESMTHLETVLQRPNPMRHMFEMYPLDEATSVAIDKIMAEEKEDFPFRAGDLQVDTACAQFTLLEMNRARLKCRKDQDNCHVITKRYNIEDEIQSRARRWLYINEELQWEQAIVQKNREFMAIPANIFAMRASLTLEILTLNDRIEAELSTLDPDSELDIPDPAVRTMKRMAHQRNECYTYRNLLDQVIAEIRSLVEQKRRVWTIKDAARLRAAAETRFHDAYPHKLVNRNSGLYESVMHGRLNQMVQVIRNHGFKRGGVYCCVGFGGCGDRQHQKSLRDGQRIQCEMTTESMESLGWRSFSPFFKPVLTHLDTGTIWYVLKSIPFAHLRLLDIDPVHNHPSSMVMTAIPVPNISTIAPEQTPGGNTQFRSDSASASASVRDQRANVQDDIIAIQLGVVLRNTCKLSWMTWVWENNHARFMSYGEMIRFSERTKLEMDMTHVYVEIHQRLTSCMASTPKPMPHIDPLPGNQAFRDSTGSEKMRRRIQNVNFKKRFNNMKEGLVSKLFIREVNHAFRAVITCDGFVPMSEVVVGTRILRTMLVKHVVTEFNMDAIKAYVDWVQERRRQLWALRSKLELARRAAPSRDNAAVADIWSRSFDLQHNDVYPSVGLVRSAKGEFHSFTVNTQKYSDKIHIGCTVEISMAGLSDMGIMNRSPSLLPSSMQAHMFARVMPERGRSELFMWMCKPLRKLLHLVPSFDNTNVNIQAREVLACEQRARVPFQPARVAPFPILGSWLKNFENKVSPLFQQVCEQVGGVDFRSLDNSCCLALFPYGITPQHGDFDGDAVAEHVPQTTTAKAETLLLQEASFHSIWRKNNSPALGLVQSTLLVMYQLTLMKHAISFSRIQLCSICINFSEFAHTRNSMPWEVPDANQVWKAICQKLEDHKRDTFRVEHVLQLMLPKGLCYRRGSSDVRITNGWLDYGTLNKKDLGTSEKNLVTTIFRDYGPKATTNFFTDVVNLSTWWLNRNPIAYGAIDLLLSADTMAKIQEATKQAQNEEERVYQELEMQKSKLTHTLEAVERASCVARRGQKAEAAFEDQAEAILTNLASKREAALLQLVDQGLGDYSRATNLACAPFLDAHPLNTNGRAVSLICRSGAKGSPADLAKMFCIGANTLDNRIMPKTLGDGGQRASADASFRISMQNQGFSEEGFLKGLEPESQVFHAISGVKVVSISSTEIPKTGTQQQDMTIMTTQQTRDFNGCIGDGTGRITIFQEDGSSNLYDAGGLAPPRPPAGIDWKRKAPSVEELEVAFEREMRGEWLLFPEFEHDRRKFKELCRVKANWLVYQQKMNVVFPAQDTLRIPLDVEDAIAKARVKVKDKVKAQTQACEMDKPINMKTLVTAHKMVDQLVHTIRQISFHVKNIAYATKTLQQVFVSDDMLEWYIRCALCTKTMVQDHKLTLRELYYTFRFLTTRYLFSRGKPGDLEGAFAASGMGEHATQDSLGAKHISAGIVKLNTGATRMRQIMGLHERPDSAIVRVQIHPDYRNKPQSFWDNTFVELEPCDIFRDFGYCPSAHKILPRSAVLVPEGCTPGLVKATVLEPEATFPWSTECMRFAIEKASLTKHQIHIHKLLGILKATLCEPWFGTSAWQTPDLFLVFVHMRMKQIEIKSPILPPPPPPPLAPQPLPNPVPAPEPVPKQKAPARSALLLSFLRRGNHDLIRSLGLMTPSTQMSGNGSANARKSRKPVTKQHIQTAFRERIKRARQMDQDRNSRKVDYIRRLSLRKSTLKSSEELVCSTQVLFDSLAEIVATKCLPPTGVSKIHVSKETDPISLEQVEVATMLLTSDSSSKNRQIHLFTQPHFIPETAYSTVTRSAHSIFGLGAGIATTLKELLDATRSIGYIHFRHLALMASWIFLTGQPMPMHRSTLPYVTNCMLEQISYQDKTNVLVSSAVAGRVSHLSGLMSEQMVGKLLWTGSNRLHVAGLVGGLPPPQTPLVDVVGSGKDEMDLQ